MGDLEDMQADLDAQVEQWGVVAAKTDEERGLARVEGWGLSRTGLLLRRLIPAAKAIRDRVVVLEGRADQGQAAIAQLRTRVSALADAVTALDARVAALEASSRRQRDARWQRAKTRRLLPTLGVAPR